MHIPGIHIFNGQSSARRIVFPFYKGSRTVFFIRMFVTGILSRIITIENISGIEVIRFIPLFFIFSAYFISLMLGQFPFSNESAFVIATIIVR